MENAKKAVLQWVLGRRGPVTGFLLRLALPFGVGEIGLMSQRSERERGGAKFRWAVVGGRKVVLVLFARLWATRLWDFSTHAELRLILHTTFITKLHLLCATRLNMTLSRDGHGDGVR